MGKILHKQINKFYTTYGIELKLGIYVRVKETSERVDKFKDAILVVVGMKLDPELRIGLALLNKIDTHERRSYTWGGWKPEDIEPLSAGTIVHEG